MSSDVGGDGKQRLHLHSPELDPGFWPPHPHPPHLPLSHFLEKSKVLQALGDGGDCGVSHSPLCEFGVWRCVYGGMQARLPPFLLTTDLEPPCAQGWRREAARGAGVFLGPFSAGLVAGGAAVLPPRHPEPWWPEHTWPRLGPGLTSLGGVGAAPPPSGPSFSFVSERSWEP